MHPSGEGSPPLPARPDDSSPPSEVVGGEAGNHPAPPNDENPVSPEEDGRRGTEDRSRRSTEADDRTPLEADDRRPTPVRMAMEGGEEEVGDAEGEPRIIEDPDSGVRWIVTVGGRSVGGILPLRTVTIMELTFAKEDGGDEGRKTVLCLGKELSEIPDHDLLASLRKAGPFREPMRSLEDRDRKGRRPKGSRTPGG